MQVDATVFTCISMLSRAMGPSIQPDIKELLEPMLAVGLRWDGVSGTVCFLNDNVRVYSCFFVHCSVLVLR